MEKGHQGDEIDDICACLLFSEKEETIACVVYSAQFTLTDSNILNSFARHSV